VVAAVMAVIGSIIAALHHPAPWLFYIIGVLILAHIPGNRI